MEVLDLFPRSIFKGELPAPLLKTLLGLGESVLTNPMASPDASSKLAGQLSQQRELRPEQPGVQTLMDAHLLPACHHWIKHVMDRQPPQGRGPWVPSRYQLQPIDLWLNCQRAGDYNPTHTHGGSFSGVIFLKVPAQINGNSFQTIHKQLMGLSLNVHQLMDYLQILLIHHNRYLLVSLQTHLKHQNINLSLNHLFHNFL